MILYVLMATAAMCPETKMVNYTKTWVEFDQKTLERAKIRCGEIYPSSPCLKLFIKKEERTYSAACGEKEKN